MNITYREVTHPEIFTDYIPVDLDDETMSLHLNNVLLSMERMRIDSLVIYADREHGANFAYLTGFEPRFEEALLIIHADTKIVFVLGNENLKMAEHSRIKGMLVHAPHFSLPYQPMAPHHSLEEILKESGISDNTTIGCVGWKHFTSLIENNAQLFDIPYFIVDAIKRINRNGYIFNASRIFLDSTFGIRNFHNANEIAHFEANAGLASSAVSNALDAIIPGITEIDIADKMNTHGAPLSITTIVSSGTRFTNAMVFPRNKKIQLGEKFSVTLGLRGGSSSRSGYVARNADDIPQSERSYLDMVVKPYYQVLVTLYENFCIGCRCASLYETIETIFPKDMYGWKLNPGHFTDDCEWSSSPMYENSSAIIQSGMMIQMDIIPNVRGFAGVSAEDGVAIADDALRNELAAKYPSTWNRINTRRNYMKNILGINIGDDLLPLSDICGYLRPFVLNHDFAMTAK